MCSSELRNVKARGPTSPRPLLCLGDDSGEYSAIFITMLLTALVFVFGWLQRTDVTRVYS